MASKGKKKASLSDLSRERWTQEEHSAIAREFSEGSDRAAALVGSSIAETGLVEAINSKFRSLTEAQKNNLFYGPTAPLGSFAAKIMLGYALGIYGAKVRSEFDKIRAIRNVFAHSPRPYSFDNPTLTHALQGLRDIKLDEFFPRGASRVPPLRAQYLAICLDLTVALERYAKQPHRHKLRIAIPDWPDAAPPPLLHRSIQPRR
jgi:hypothetical protein